MGYDMYARRAEEHPDDGYFRLNIWGMGVARGCMRPRAMIIDCPEPKYPGHNATDEQLKAWREATYEAPGIPIFKLGSNDGWHVNKIECQGALAMLDKYDGPNDDLPEWWSEWVDYLRRCGEVDGFEVH